MVMAADYILYWPLIGLPVNDQLQGLGDIKKSLGSASNY